MFSPTSWEVEELATPIRTPLACSSDARGSAVWEDVDMKMRLKQRI